jgi:predicted nicotinamide N-methyase
LSAAAFILGHTAVTSPPACPELRLHLASEVTPLWEATETYLDRSNIPPPYWAFPWVGGQALARYILDNPELVAGKSVLDFASGSGLVGIAARMAGAAQVLATDIDEVALIAIGLNMKENGVVIDISDRDVLDETACPWDVIVAGDVCYEKPMAEKTFAWLRRCSKSGAKALMADPGRAYLPKTGLMRLAQITVACSLDLEDKISREVGIFQIVG